MSVTAYDPLDQPPGAPATSVLPANQRLGANPQLPQHPLGQYTDSSYEADVAALRSEIAKRHADVLRQLGYADDQGNFIMGSVESEANRQRADLARSQRLAGEGVTNEAQRQGTLFSGYRGIQQARSTHPFVQALADLDVSVPESLSQLYEQGAGLIDEFNIRNNQLLAAAAQRRAAAITASGGVGGTLDAATAASGGVVPPPPSGGAGGVGGATDGSIYAGMGDLPTTQPNGVGPPLPGGGGVGIDIPSPVGTPIAQGVLGPADFPQAGAGLTAPNLSGLGGTVQSTGVVPHIAGTIAGPVDNAPILSAAQRKLLDPRYTA